MPEVSVSVRTQDLFISTQCLGKGRGDRVEGGRRGRPPIEAKHMSYIYIDIVIVVCLCVDMCRYGSRVRMGAGAGVIRKGRPPSEATQII